VSPGGRSSGTTLRQHAPGRHRLPLSVWPVNGAIAHRDQTDHRIASSSSAGKHSLIAFCLDGRTLEIELLTTRASCSPHLARSLTGAADCPDPHQLQRPQSMAGQRLSEVQKRPRRPRNLHRGEGIPSALACPHRRTTRISTSIWPKPTRSSVPTAGRGSADPRLTPLDADPPDSFSADGFCTRLRWL
jgi:hypothetical protein